MLLKTLSFSPYKKKKKFFPYFLVMVQKDKKGGKKKSLKPATTGLRIVSN